MKYTTKYVGLDVSKETIAIAIAEAGREKARYWGVIRNEPAAVRKLIRQLGKVVVAPSLIPARPGDQVKTDRRDALRLAELFRAGELTGVYVPTVEDEALRDLVRAREDAREDVHRAKQRLIKFLLRHGIRQPEQLKKRWTMR